MTCRPELVTAYFDDALDIAERRRIEAHLAGCASCLAQLTAERRVRAVLRSLPRETLPAGLERRVSRMLLPKRLSWVQIAVPVVACLLAAVLVARGEPWFVVHEIAADHVKCFERKNVPAVVWSSDMNLVARWFSQQGARLPFLPEHVGELTLVGTRFCPLPDLTLTPHLYYASRTEPVSVFAVRHRVRFSPHYRAYVFGQVVGLIRVGEVVVGVVAKDEATVQAFEGAILNATAVARFP